jgi:hypothetical protein
MPMTMPAVSEASTRPLPRCSVMGPVPVLPDSSEPIIDTLHR